MEILYLVGLDTPLNIINEPTLGQKVSPPTINVHIKTGGINVQEIEDFLQQDNDLYDDMIYLTIPSQFIETYKASQSFKWLLSKVANDVCHTLICSNELYNSLTHRSCLKWTKAPSIVQELVDCHSPFTRIVSDQPHLTTQRKTYVDLYVAPTNTTSPQRDQHVLPLTTKPIPFHKMYSGCILHQESKVPHVIQPEFVAYVNATEPFDSYPYRYEANGIIIVSKRPISTFLNHYRNLYTLHTFVTINGDLTKLNGNLINMFEDNLIPFELFDSSKQGSRWPKTNSLVLDHNVALPNLFMLVNFVRKCPSFDTFDLLLLHSTNDNHAMVFDQLGSNDIFASCRFRCPTDKQQIVCNAKAFLLTAHNDLRDVESVDKVLIPFIPPCYVTLLQEEVKEQPTYYAESLGDTDLADQMLQYASIRQGGFQVQVNRYKDRWNRIGLSLAFQNTPYEPTNPKNSSFLLNYYPCFYRYIFHSSIFLAAKSYLSHLLNWNYCIGVHFKRQKASLPLTLSCSLQYYKEATQRIVERTEGLILCFVIVGQPNDDFISYLQEQKHKHVLVKETESPEMSMAILANCQGLILSSSSFAWWSGMLNRHASVVVAPTRWINPLHWFHNGDLERKHHQQAWITVEN